MDFIPKLTQLIYSSQPFGYDSTLLSTILNDARRCNIRDNISGALVCRHDIYLQLLEGPSEAVNAAYMRIIRDDRHVGAKKLVSRPVAERIFENWAMLHDPAISLIWSQEQIKSGILDQIPPSDIVDMFKSIATNSKLENFDY
ncbi:BLUF domain-containing protein [Ascidiaceihabitans sp.]|nr:BLUF domain-containing protein [Ascidiaceihabitans sp.]